MTGFKSFISYFYKCINTCVVNINVHIFVFLEKLFPPPSNPGFCMNESSIEVAGNIRTIENLALGPESLHKI